MNFKKFLLAFTLCGVMAFGSGCSSISEDVDLLIPQIERFDSYASTTPSTVEIENLKKEISFLSYEVDDYCRFYNSHKSFSNETCYFFFIREKNDPREGKTRGYLFDVSDATKRVTEVLRVFNEKYEIEASPKS